MSSRGSLTGSGIVYNFGREKRKKILAGLLEKEAL